MNIVFDTINITLTIAAIIYFVFLGLIFFKGKDRLIKNSYSVVIVAIFLWTLSMILYRSAGEATALFWCLVLYVSATFTASSFFIFSLIFPYGKMPKKHWFYIAGILNVATIAIILIPSALIKGVKVINGGENIIYWGPLYILFSLYISIFFLAGLVILLKKYWNEEGRIKSQIKFVFWGYMIGSNIAMITNMVMLYWGDFRFNWFGQIAALVMVALTVYAIIAHRLLDIRFVLRRYSVLGISIVQVFLLAVLAKYFSIWFIEGNELLVDVVILSTVVTIYPSVQKKTFHVANKYFFSSLYDSSKLISDIGNKLKSTLDVELIYNYIYETLNDAMHIESFGVLRFDKGRQVYRAQFNKNFDIGNRVEFEVNDYIHENFVCCNIPFVVSEAHGMEKDAKTKETISLLHRLKVEVLLPLKIKEEVVGLMALGSKISGDMFNDEDLQVLSIIASQSAIAIENATLYEETKQFGQRMEEEVKKATKDLRAANERLKKLDAAKSEFISIASHQLRTPLTVIKGYISMMLEGSFGKIPGKMDESLEKVYVSNERLISLVENLLNISRIESGRLKFSYKTIQLEDMVESVCEELDTKAKEKGLKLEFKRLKNDLPKVTLDTEKVRQVVMNLIDNAVKYTPKGKVTVTLKKKEDKLLFCVADKGMGISATDLPNLFKKFSRGSGAKLEHTEGTGLGLFVARQMIEAHHGRVWAESPGEGKGSKFCFEIPYDKPGQKKKLLEEMKD